MKSDYPVLVVSDGGVLEKSDYPVLITPEYGENIRENESAQNY
jgi:hypothetical protein